MVSISQERFSVQIPILKATPLSPEMPKERASSYPLPWLEATSEFKTMDFAAIVLENPTLRVVLLPDLGGRIISFFDKRTETELLNPSDLRVSETGPRGIEIESGVEIGPFNRLNSLGPVEFEVGEDYVRFLDLCPGSRLSSQIELRMHDSKPQLMVQVRIVNRGLDNAWIDDGIHFHGANLIRSDLSLTAYAAQFDHGWIAIDAGNHVFRAVDKRKLYRFFSTMFLPGTATDTWRFTLAPVTSLRSLEAVSRDLAISHSEGSLKIVSTLETEPIKVVIETKDGRLLETRIDSFPEGVAELDTSGVGSFRQIAFLDNNGVVRLAYYAGLEPTLKGQDPEATTWEQVRLFETFLNMPEVAGVLETFRFRLETRTASHVTSAILHCRKQEFEDALDHVDSALLHMADNHLIWWLKATIERQIGADEDSSALLNAHYLCPSEPLLRAESLLSQPIPEGREPSPLLAPLADNPDALIEVAAWLYELEFWEDLFRWCDETFRHRDVAMLRYFLALAHLRKGSEFEAASQIQRADKLPLEPPYPSRSTEILIINRLSERFPDNAKLKQLLELVSWSGNFAKGIN